MRAGKPRRFSMAAVTVLGIFACIGGCGSPTTHHYVLSPVVDASPGDPASPTARLVVGIGPVSIPPYLDRPQLVVRPAPDRIEVSEFGQWGEPVRDAVTRVVSINLARLLPESRVVPFPWRSGEKVRYQVVLDIDQMDGPAEGDLVLDVQWRIIDGSGREIAARVSRVSEPAASGTMAAAMSRALGALSRDMARELEATARRVP